LKTKEKELITPFQPKLITGGYSSNPNWLADLKPFTVFLCRLKNTNKQQTPRWMLTELCVHQNDGVAVQLISNIGDDRWMWVHSLDFSMEYELIKIVQEGKNEQPDAGDLEGYAGPEVGEGLPEVSE
jgi:hypothetical protein